jgi:methionine-rich copper-binding protein CopC
MKRSPGKWVSGLLALAATSFAVVVTADAAPSDAVMPHIVLESSVPEDESVTAEPVQEIRLYFSDAPLMRGASVRVVTSARQLMRTSPPTPDPDDGKQVYVEVDPPLPPGSYRVQWRCIADDGHVMRGAFAFEVAAE